MDQTFVILFSGLYALLSGDPGAPSAPAAHVLLVDARKNSALELPEHSPVLTVPFGDVVPMGAAADATVVLPDGSAYSVWRLDHQTVTISGDLAGPASLSEVKNTRRSGSQKPAGTREIADTSWIARMSTLGIGSELDPAVFAEPARSALAARVELRRGALSTGSLLKNKKDILTFAFRKGGRPENPPVLEQAMADVVRYAVPLSGEGVVTLTLSPWAKGGTARTVQLRSKDGPVTATISNQPVIKHDVRDDDVVMKHYSAFYELLRNRPASSERPLPVANWKPTPKNKTLQTSHCAPGGFP